MLFLSLKKANIMNQLSFSVIISMNLMNSLNWIHSDVSSRSPLNKMLSAPHKWTEIMT